MKKVFYALIVTFVISVTLSACGAKNAIADNPQPSETPETSQPSETETTPETSEIGADENANAITQEMAYEGVYNYCRDAYDWTVAEDDPSIMYVEMGEESETEYQVIFRSYTGAFVYFYVDKSDGAARMTEYVPALNIERDAGTVNIRDYLNGTEARPEQNQVKIMLPDGEGQIGVQAVVVSDEISVHQEPDADSEVVNALQYGDLIILSRQSDGWAEYVDSDAEDAVPEGWIETDGLLINPALVRTNGKTPVYSEKDTSSPEVALLDEDYLLPVLRTDGDWLLVRPDGATGWIYYGRGE